MNTYTLKSRSVPLSDEWDVIVAGGGPAGCAAAAAAARQGAKTLLIEATGSLGGSGTNALVPAWCPFSDQQKIIYRGIAEEVFTAAKTGMVHVRMESTDWVPIDAERLKRVYDDLVINSGASILFNTVLSSVECEEDGGVSTILVTNKRGLSALKAKVYIDCTGDADLAAWAGAEFHKGDENGELMPATHCFVLSNVDFYIYHNTYRDGGHLHSSDKTSPIFDILKSAKYPLIPDSHICNNTVGADAVGFNAGHLWNVDNTDPESISKALVQGRKMAAQFRDALAEYCPDAFGNAFLIQTANQVGIRETRRIVGDYSLTLDDYLCRRSFPDEVCRNSYFIDVHPSMMASAQNTARRSDGLEQAMRYGPGESHGIPYRCMVPQKLRNVLVAGRSISCERVVQGSVRTMPGCLTMGQAAGTAGAMAAMGHQGDVRAIDISDLRQRLDHQ